MTGARDLTTALGGRWHGRYGLAFCPAHDNTRTPALSLTDGEDGRLLVHCHAGCDFRDVIGAIRGRGLLDGAPRTFRPDAAATARNRAHEREARQRRTRMALDVWTSAEPIKGTLGERYLRQRSIVQLLPDALRFHPATWHGATASRRPAMIAAVMVGDDVVAVHRTYLAEPGRKADVQPAKAMLGPCAGGAVKLAESGKLLMVGEGVETCLAAMQATGNPTWAALSTSGLKTLDLPRTVREVVVLADGDDPGEAAARDCARRWASEGRRVRIARPPRGKDFNDLLMERVSSAREGAG